MPRKKSTQISKPDRVTFVATDISRKRLDQECERLKGMEGATVAAARVLNDLILHHLPPAPDEHITGGEPRKRRRRKVMLVKTA